MILDGLWLVIQNGAEILRKLGIADGEFHICLACSDAGTVF